MSSARSTTALGLLTNHGKVKEQGRVFKQLADADRGKTVTFPAQPLGASPVYRDHEAVWKGMLDRDEVERERGSGSETAAKSRTAARAPSPPQEP